MNASASVASVLRVEHEATAKVIILNDLVAEGCGQTLTFFEVSKKSRFKHVEDQLRQSIKTGLSCGISLADAVTRAMLQCRPKTRQAKRE